MSTRTNHLGNRLVIYYGRTGVGKTYTAQMEYPGSKSILCLKSMTPADLLNQGLREAMETGESVILEDVNHLSESCLSLLLDVCDGRAEYDQDGGKIEIKDDFKVVATARFWEGSAESSGYDRRIELLLRLVAGADARECYMTLGTTMTTALHPGQ